MRLVYFNIFYRESSPLGMLNGLERGKTIIGFIN